MHHGFTYTFEEGLDALPDVIRHIETYDVTTIRASTPMYLLARRIKAMGVKMVLSGEGSRRDLRRLPVLPQGARTRASSTKRPCASSTRCTSYDCLRANKAMMAWGVEARVPFLDVEFLDVAMAHGRAAQDGGGSDGARIEKAVLREAFAGYLPDVDPVAAEGAVQRRRRLRLDRRPEGACAKRMSATRCSPRRRSASRSTRRRPRRPTGTAHMFEQHFPGEACARTVPGGKSIACSSPAAIAWDAAFANAADPSGRAVAGVHQAALG